MHFIVRKMLCKVINFESQVISKVKHFKLLVIAHLPNLNPFTHISSCFYG